MQYGKGVWFARRPSSGYRFRLLSEENTITPLPPIRKECIVKLLTARQRAFCDAYVSCGNATQAARDAGYSKKTAYVIGHENLRKPHIIEHIKAKQNEISSQRILTATQRQEILSDIATGKGFTADRIRAINELNKMTGEHLQRIDLDANVTSNGRLEELLEAIEG